MNEREEFESGQDFPSIFQSKQGWNLCSESIVGQGKAVRNNVILKLLSFH